ncbi:MAG: hypothetical protein J5851_00650 [Oscillospiraceae bacterium]|nr:hypothetical protein [Oscillospiraceae bacterium]
MDKSKLPMLSRILKGISITLFWLSCIAFCFLLIGAIYAGWAFLLYAIATLASGGISALLMYAVGEICDELVWIHEQMSTSTVPSTSSYTVPENGDSVSTSQLSASQKEALENALKNLNR